MVVASEIGKMAAEKFFNFNFIEVKRDVIVQESSLLHPILSVN